MKKSFYLGGGKTGMARRLSWDEPSLTLTCAPAQKQTERCHPDETRPLATREYARIQTFPDEWRFSGPITSIYKQIGNAVPVNLAYAVGRSLIRLLNDVELLSPSETISKSSEVYDILILPDLPLFNASDKRAKYSAKNRAKRKKGSKPKKKG
jgi:DNA (cytosine-5)-methyltransferase 1